MSGIRASIVRWVQLLALIGEASGCSDLAEIGALCPVNCSVRMPERVCACAAASAGAGVDAAVIRGDDAAANGGVDAAAALDAGGVGATCGTGADPAGAQGNLIVAVDNSASVIPWWPALSEGFQRFVREDASHGLGVGLLRFDDVCDTAAYLSTLVPIEPLPNNLAALEAAIPSAAATTTSTIPVLSAALQYGSDWLRDHAKARVAVLLISDASPGVCDGLSGMYESELTRIAGEGFSGTPSIATYAIGGDQLQHIAAIAAAGGTQATMIPPLSTSDAVLGALREIRSALSASACSSAP